MESYKTIFKMTIFKCTCIIHRMEYHQQQLTKHCRICGKRLLKLKSHGPVYSCHKFTPDLLSTFGVDTSKDSPTIHPDSFCNSCYPVLKRAEKARLAGVPYHHSTKPMEWTAHGDGCLVRKSTQWYTYIILFVLYIRRSVNTSWVLGLVEVKTGRWWNTQADPLGKPQTLFCNMQNE